MLTRLKRLDIMIVFIITCFGVFSTLIIQSATENTRFEGLHRSHMMMYALMYLPMLVTAFINYRFIIRYFSYLLYGVGILSLVLTLTHGLNKNGSTRWIGTESLQFQPSELVKIFIILALAKFLAGREGEPLRFRQDIVPIGLFTAVPIILILLQPDLGTSIVFVCIMVAMLWVGNIKLWQAFIGLSGVTGAVLGFFTMYKYKYEWIASLLKPHQLYRIETFLDSSLDPATNWHVYNAIMAISTGGLYGKGFKEGFFVQNGYVPYQYADSIFVVIGEEFGFMGSALLLLLYFLLIYRMIVIAYQSSSLAGTYLITGIIAMLVLQIFENIAMHIDLMPLTGIALPFISYGGSSLLTNMVSIGLVLSVHIYRDVELRAV